MFIHLSLQLQSLLILAGSIPCHLWFNRSVADESLLLVAQIAVTCHVLLPLVWFPWPSNLWYNPPLIFGAFLAAEPLDLWYVRIVTVPK